MRTRWAGLAVLAFALGAVTGCGQATDAPGIASAAGTGAATTAPADNLTEAERRAKFAECMRGKGIDVPDPEGDQQGGGFVFKFEGQSSGGPAPKEVEAAMTACKAYLPNGGEPPNLSPEDIENSRKHARCMRENGVPDFPDPDDSGRIKMKASPGSGLGPKDPVFKAARDKCRESLPNKGKGGAKDGDIGGGPGSAGNG